MKIKNKFLIIAGLYGVFCFTWLHGEDSCDECDISNPPPTCCENNGNEDCDSMPEAPVYDDMPLTPPKE